MEMAAGSRQTSPQEAGAAHTPSTARTSTSSAPKPGDRAGDSTPLAQAAVPLAGAASLQRRLEQAAVLFILLMQLVLYSRVADSLTPRQHAHQAALASLRIGGLLLATYLPPQSWQRWRVCLIGAMRISIALIPSQKSSSVSVDGPALSCLLTASQGLHMAALVATPATALLRTTLLALNGSCCCCWRNCPVMHAGGACNDAASPSHPRGCWSGPGLAASHGRCAEPRCFRGADLVQVAGPRNSARQQALTL